MRQTLSACSAAPRGRTAVSGDAGASAHLALALAAAFFLASSSAFFFASALAFSSAALRQWERSSGE